MLKIDASQYLIWDQDRLVACNNCRICTALTSVIYLVLMSKNRVPASIHCIFQFIPFFLIFGRVDYRPWQQSSENYTHIPTIWCDSPIIRSPTVDLTNQYYWMCWAVKGDGTRFKLTIYTVIGYLVVYLKEFFELKLFAVLTFSFNLTSNSRLIQVRVLTSYDHYLVR